MNPAWLAKLVSGYSSGLLTSVEVANTLLEDLIADATADIEVRSTVAELPGEVRGELLDLLRNIKRADYRWKPFLIGSGETPDADPAILQWICAELGVV